MTLHIGDLVLQQHRLEPWIWHNDNDAKFTVYDEREVPVIVVMPIVDEPGLWWAADLRHEGGPDPTKHASCIEALQAGSRYLQRYLPAGSQG